MSHRGVDRGLDANVGAMGMRGAIAAATLIHRVSRPAAPASHLKEALLAALPVRAVRLVMAAALAGEARPGPEAAATAGAAAAAAASAARLCACSNSVCHAVLQAGWGDEEGGGGGSGGDGGGGVAVIIDAEARSKLGVAAAAALSTSTPVGSAVEALPRTSAAALRCMLTSAHGDTDGCGGAAALAAARALRRFVSRGRDASTLCSVGAHTVGRCRLTV